MKNSKLCLKYKNGEKKNNYLVQKILFFITPIKSIIIHFHHLIASLLTICV